MSRRRWGVELGRRKSRIKSLVRRFRRLSPCIELETDLAKVPCREPFRALPMQRHRSFSTAVRSGGHPCPPWSRGFPARRREPCPSSIALDRWVSANLRDTPESGGLEAAPLRQAGMPDATGTCSPLRGILLLSTIGTLGAVTGRAEAVLFKKRHRMPHIGHRMTSTVHRMAHIVRRAARTVGRVAHMVPDGAVRWAG